MGTGCGAARCVKDLLLCPCDCVCVGGGSCLICVGVSDRLCAHCAVSVVFGMEAVAELCTLGVSVCVIVSLGG